MSNRQTFVAGSVEYLTVTVTADVTLDTQPVALSLDKGVTWLACTWQGSAATTRKARTTSPITFSGTWRNAAVLVKITDTPEIPIVNAGGISVVNA